MAYDTEAVRQKGFDAVTNFDLSEYADVLAEHHASRRARRTLSHPIPEPEDPNAPASLPAASIKQRLKAASESSFGGMREGPAAEREPRGEAIDAVRAFFRDAGVEKALTPMDPIREMATSAGNAAAAVAAARERNARTTWATRNDKGTLLDDEGDLDLGGGRRGRGRDHDPGAPRDGEGGEDAAGIDTETAGGCDDRDGRRNGNGGPGRRRGEKLAGGGQKYFLLASFTRLLAIVDKALRRAPTPEPRRARRRSLATKTHPRRTGPVSPASSALTRQHTQDA